MLCYKFQIININYFIWCKKNSKDQKKQQLLRLQKLQQQQQIQLQLQLQQLQLQQVQIQQQRNQQQPSYDNINWNELSVHFKKVQEKNQRYKHSSCK